MIVVQLALTKLDSKTLREWKRQIKEDPMTWSALLKFLKEMSRSLDDEEMTMKPKSEEQSEECEDVKLRSKSGKTSCLAQGEDKLKCTSCGGDHFLMMCSEFRGMAVKDRYVFAKEQGLCWNCLIQGHRVGDCTSENSCSVCSKKHHTLLHLESSQNTSEQPGNSLTSKPFEPFSSTWRQNFDGKPTINSNVVSHAAESINQMRRTLLSTVVINVKDGGGNFHCARALLDTGSDDNFATIRFARKLGLRCNDVCIPLTGIGKRMTTVTQQTSATISSLYGLYEKQLNFSVIPSITGLQPATNVKISEWKIPEKMILADPNFNISGQIDMLLNIDVFFDVLINEQVELMDGPKMIHTKFGWIIGGAINMWRKSSQVILSSKNAPPTNDNKCEPLATFDDTTQSDPDATKTKQSHLDSRGALLIARSSGGSEVPLIPPEKNSQQELENLAPHLHHINTNEDPNPPTDSPSPESSKLNASPRKKCFTFSESSPELHDDSSKSRIKRRNSRQLTNFHVLSSLARPRSRRLHRPLSQVALDSLCNRRRHASRRLWRF
jgi:hypothetical protein